MNYADSWKEEAYIVCYNNSVVNDLHNLGFNCIIKPDINNKEELSKLAQWIDKGLQEIIVVKRANEPDYIALENKKKLHFTIEYHSERFPESRKEEIEIALKHLSKNYRLNKAKRFTKERTYKEDSEIIKNLL